MPAIRKPAAAAADDDQPTTRRTRREARPKTPKAVPTEVQIAQGLTQFYTVAGMGLSAMGRMKRVPDPGLMQTGVAMVERADALAQEWLDLAKTNPRVRKALEAFAGGAGLSGIVLLHAAILAPFLASRGVIPEPVAGIALMITQEGFDPTALFAQMGDQGQNGSAATSSAAPPHAETV